MDNLKYEAYCKAMMAEQLESSVLRLKDKLDSLSGITEKMKANPRKALREMKEEQLKTVLERYVSIATNQPLERIAMALVENQATEKQIRFDIKQLGESEENEKHLKKQLEIAKRVLAEKKKPGGRQ